MRRNQFRPRLELKGSAIDPPVRELACTTLPAGANESAFRSSTVLSSIFSEGVLRAPRQSRNDRCSRLYSTARLGTGTDSENRSAGPRRQTSGLVPRYLAGCRIRSKAFDIGLRGPIW